MSQTQPPYAPHPLLKITSAAQLALRGRILEAARQRFARFSQENSTFADIARSAGVAEDEVRQHFGDKLALLVALQRGLDGTQSAARRRAPQPGRSARGGFTGAPAGRVTR